MDSNEILEAAQRKYESKLREVMKRRGITDIDHGKLALSNETLKAAFEYSERRATEAVEEARDCNTALASANEIIRRYNEDEAEADAHKARLTTILDEAWGPFPVMTMDDLLTKLEESIHTDHLKFYTPKMVRQEALVKIGRELGELGPHTMETILTEVNDLIARARAETEGT